MGKYNFLRPDKRITLTEARYMIINSDREDIKALIAVLWLTGARISEILLMTDESIREGEDDTVELVMTTLKRKKKQKSAISEARILIFNKDTPFLQLFLDYAKTKFWKIFPNLSRGSAWYHIKKVNQNVSPHIFRHSRLQILADRGARAQQIRAFAGHASIISANPYIIASKQLMRPLKELIA